LQKREKNKVAAEKCRIKRRDRVQQTRSEYDCYVEANETLDAQIRRLKEERQMLEDILKGHTCNLKQQQHQIRV
jgi:cell division protein FtsB